MLFEFLTGVLGNVAVTAGERAVVKLLAGDEVKNAIRATAEEFPENPRVKSALTRWCASDEFQRQLEAFREGVTSHALKDEVDSFIEIGLFYESIHDTHRKAAAVIQAFKEHLEREIYRRPGGLLVESKRADARYRDHQAGLDRLEERLGRVPTKEDLREILPGRDGIFNIERETSIKYEHEPSPRDFHELKFISRPGRNIEITLQRAKPKHGKNALRVSFIFGAEARILLSNPLQDLKDLIYQRSLSWITYEGPGPWHRWTIRGEILLASFPQLKYLTWLDRDFTMHPTLSSSPDPGDPAYSSNVSFTLLEPGP